MFYELIFRAGPFPPSPSASQPCFFMRQWAGFETNPVIGSFDPSTSLRFAQGSLSSLLRTRLWRAGRMGIDYSGELVIMPANEEDFGHFIYSGSFDNFRVRRFAISRRCK